MARMRVNFLNHTHTVKAHTSVTTQWLEQLMENQSPQKVNLGNNSAGQEELPCSKARMQVKDTKDPSHSRELLRDRRTHPLCAKMSHLNSAGCCLRGKEYRPLLECVVRTVEARRETQPKSWWFELDIRDRALLPVHGSEPPRQARSSVDSIAMLNCYYGSKGRLIAPKLYEVKYMHHYCCQISRFLQSATVDDIN